MKRIIIIEDQEKTVNEAEKNKNLIMNNNYSISVGSIRYNSGLGEPDTRAISSVLRLNTDNTKTKVLTEVSSSDSINLFLEKFIIYLKMIISNQIFQLNLIKLNSELTLGMREVIK